MNTNARNFARLVAIPAMGHVWHVAGEVIVAAALGLGDTADPDTGGQSPVDPGYSYPDTAAKPAPTTAAGKRGHDGPQHIADLLDG